MEDKLKIVKTEGCVVSGIDINGEDISYLDDSKKKEYYLKILDWLKNNYSEANLKIIIDTLIDYYGDYKYLYTCKQCGDSVFESTIEI